MTKDTGFCQKFTRFYNKGYRYDVYHWMSTSNLLFRFVNLIELFNWCLIVYFIKNVDSFQEYVRIKIFK